MNIKQLFDLSGISGDSVAPEMLALPVQVLRDDSRQLTGQLIEGAGEVLVWDSRNKPSATAEILAHAAAKGVPVVTNDMSAVEAEGVITVAEPGRVLAAWAAQQWPAQPPVMLGVTATSGKTSVVWLARQLAAAVGLRAASVGTFGVMTSDVMDEADYNGFTSPTALQAHPLLADLAARGVTHCAMEVSSHALALHRLDGVRFAAAGLTNITQDHLDFHGDLPNYHAAKLRLFGEVLPAGKTAVLNMPRPECWPAAAMAKARGCPVLSVGTHGAELVVKPLASGPFGLELGLNFDGVQHVVRVPLLGTFQAENLAMALGLLVAGGVAWGDLVRVVARVTGVPGRLQLVPGKPGQPTVLVDYAHKADALQRVLEGLRPQVPAGGKLRVVFGCGGNRDALKRPVMGRIAAELADYVVVTDDNPRQEEAATIRAAVLAGARGAARQGVEIIEIGDRKTAIEATLAASGPDDVVLVAGKGHEDGQIVGHQVLPFSDSLVVATWLQSQK